MAKHVESDKGKVRLIRLKVCLSSVQVCFPNIFYGLRKMDPNHLGGGKIKSNTSITVNWTKLKD